MQLVSYICPESQFFVTAPMSRPKNAVLPLCDDLDAPQLQARSRKLRNDTMREMTGKSDLLRLFQGGDHDGREIGGDSLSDIRRERLCCASFIEENMNLI